MRTLLLMSLVVVKLAFAQAPATIVTAAGGVEGSVMCSDTHRPARFALVVIVPKPSSAETITPEGPNIPAKEKHVDATRIVMASGRTGLDGSYAIRGVPPGDYYVLAKLAGYIGLVSEVHTDDDLDGLDNLLKSAPVAHVVANMSANADLTLNRGGMITGAVRFEGGTGLADAEVKAESSARINLLGSLDRGPSWTGQGRYSGTTDDEGRYRLAGLPPGKYRVHVKLKVGGACLSQLQAILKSDSFSRTA